MKPFALIFFVLALARSALGETPEVSADITRTTAGETTIHLSFVTVAAPEKLWRAITSVEELTKWVAPEAKVELKAGGVYEYYYNPRRGQGRRGMEGTRILSYVPGKILSHSGVSPDSWVVWSIEPAGDQQVLHYYAVGSTEDWSDTASARANGLLEQLEKLAKHVQP